jgi:chromosome segregation ATPase
MTDKKKRFFQLFETREEISSEINLYQGEIQKPLFQVTVPEIDLNEPADQIITNALASFEGKAATVEYLESLIESMPPGSSKEHIEKMLTFNGVMINDIRADADEKIAALNATVDELGTHQRAKTDELNRQILELEEEVEEMKSKIRSISELTITVREKAAKMAKEIREVLSHIE